MNGKKMMIILSLQRRFNDSSFLIDKTRFLRPNVNDSYRGILNSLLKLLLKIWAFLFASARSASENVLPSA